MRPVEFEFQRARRQVGKLQDVLQSSELEHAQVQRPVLGSVVFRRLSGGWDRRDVYTAHRMLVVAKQGE